MNGLYALCLADPLEAHPYPAISVRRKTRKKKEDAKTIMNKLLGKETKASKNTSALFARSKKKKQEKMVRHVYPVKHPKRKPFAALVTFYLHVPASGESKKKGIHLSCDLIGNKSGTHVPPRPYCLVRSKLLFCILYLHCFSAKNKIKMEEIVSLRLLASFYLNE